MIYKAKKSLGQNFLKSIPALKMMCTQGELTDKDIVVEIGPGKGALTEKLLEKVGQVIAIEKDRELIDILKERFQKEIENKKLILLNEDILEFNPQDIFLKFSENQENNKYKIIANIPYNITGAILKKFLSSTFQPEMMILLVQKEVAMRIVANDKKESILSISVKAYGTPKYIMKVEKRFFSPSPKVDSAIIAIKNISNKNFLDKKDQDSFFNIVKSGFAHKRKVLRKNLEEITSLNTIDSMYSEFKINPKTRAEDLPFQTWIKINNYLKNFK
jgi:16S rRNA (adenine1518-N6/adenine1519-N6)-dimethyltransferase